MSKNCTPTESDLRRAYTEAAGATPTQESYYAEQVAEFERGIARIKADAWDEGLWAGEGYHQDRRDFGDMILDVEPEAPTNPYREEASDGPVRRG